AVGYLGLALVGLSPTLWRVWHNQLHHGNTNVPDTDPDSYGTLARFRTIPAPAAKFLLGTSVGSGQLAAGMSFFLTGLSVQAQVVLWVQSVREKHLYRGLRRRRAIVESVLLWCFWIALGFVLGARGAFFAIFVPWLILNFIVMSYIATNHFLR